MIEKGASVDIPPRDTNGSPLSHAIRCATPQILDLLVQSGALPRDMESSRLLVALDAAVDKTNIQILRRLINIGTDVGSYHSSDISSITSDSVKERITQILLNRRYQCRASLMVALSERDSEPVMKILKRARESPSTCGPVHNPDMASITYRPPITHRPVITYRPTILPGFYGVDSGRCEQG